MRHPRSPADRLPFGARAANMLGALARRAGAEPVRLSVPALLDDARRTAGLSDFGDPAFEEPLRRLVASLEGEARLSLTGRVGLRNGLVRNLVNRLQIQEALARHPEIKDVPVERPIFILGFPRTGSTLLHRLLAQLPGARVPLLWELFRPAPPPVAETRASDPRIAVAEKDLRGLLYLAPQLPSIHPFGAREPEECLHLLENAFLCASYGFYCHVPGYLAWLQRQDMVPAYRYYRTQLQVLSYRTPGAPWVLKWPGHMLNLDALLAVFPDACVIQTHRTLQAVAPSSCSYSATLKRVFSDEVSPAEIGRQWLDDSAFVLERALAARARLGEDRFHDLRYPDLMADPSGALRRIVARFNLPAGAQLEEAARANAPAHPAGQHGAHRYSLEQFGLGGALVAERFRAYHERFGLDAAAR